MKPRLSAGVALLLYLAAWIVGLAISAVLTALAHGWLHRIGWWCA